MERNPQQILSVNFSGMSYEPGKSLHQPPWAMRPALRPAGVNRIARIDTFIFLSILTSGLQLYRRDEALSHHGPLWLIPLILTVRADMPRPPGTAIIVVRYIQWKYITSFAFSLMG